MATNVDLSRIGANQAHEDTHNGRFTRTIGAHQAHDLPRGEFQIEWVQYKVSVGFFHRAQ